MPRSSAPSPCSLCSWPRAARGPTPTRVPTSRPRGSAGTSCSATPAATSSRRPGRRPWRPATSTTPRCPPGSAPTWGRSSGGASPRTDPIGGPWRSSPPSVRTSSPMPGSVASATTTAPSHRPGRRVGRCPDSTRSGTRRGSTSSPRCWPNVSCPRWVTASTSTCPSACILGASTRGGTPTRSWPGWRGVHHPTPSTPKGSAGDSVPWTPRPAGRRLPVSDRLHAARHAAGLRRPDRPRHGTPPPVLDPGRGGGGPRRLRPLCGGRTPGRGGPGGAPGRHGRGGGGPRDRAARGAQRHGGRRRPPVVGPRVRGHARRAVAGPARVGAGQLATHDLPRFAAFWDGTTWRTGSVGAVRRTGRATGAVGSAGVPPWRPTRRTRSADGDAARPPPSGTTDPGGALAAWPAAPGRRARRGGPGRPGGPVARAATGEPAR